MDWAKGRIVIIPFLHGIRTAVGEVIEPDIDAILAKWLERHPEYRDKKYHVIRPRSYQVDDLATVLVRVTADCDDDLANYDPAEDADLYEEFLMEDPEAPQREFHRIWIQQCDAVEQIEAQYGTEKAMGYLIGEKLLNFLEEAERQPEWRAEIPHFVDRIKSSFEPWLIAQFFETPRRLGVLGHTADEQGQKILHSEVEESEKVRQDARNLMLFEWARELLLGEGGP